MMRRSPQIRPPRGEAPPSSAMTITDLPVTTADAQGDSTQHVAIVSMGNPHAVQFLDAGTPAEYPLHRIGPLMEHHPVFTQRTNYEVVRVVDRSHIDMRVWERGVGETMACGSGACATLVNAARRGLTGRQASILLPGGELGITWREDGHVLMTGPVEFEREGAFDPSLFAAVRA